MVINSTKKTAVKLITKQQVHNYLMTTLTLFIHYIHSKGWKVVQFQIT